MNVVTLGWEREEQVRRNFSKFLEPFGSSTDSAQQLNSRLLSVIIVVCFFICLLAFIVDVSVNSIFTVGLPLIIDVSGLVLLIVLFILNKRGMYHLAVSVLLLIFILVTFVLVVLKQDQPNALGLTLYLAIPIFLSVLFLSLKQALFVIIGVLSLMILVPLFFFDISVLFGQVAYVTYLLGLSLLMIVTIRHKNNIEQLHHSDLQRSKAKLKSIFNSSPSAITMTDLQGTIIECNQAAMNFYDTSVKEELIGKNSLELLAARDRKKAQEDMRITLENGKQKHVRYNFLKKDGTEYPGELSAGVVKDGKDTPLGFVAISTDITDKKKAQEQLRRSEQNYRQLYENLRDGHAAVDMNGRIIKCNQSFVDMLGYTKEELFHLSYEDITPRKWHTIERDILENQVLKRGYSDLYEKEYIRKDGTIFPIELTTYLVKDENKRPKGFWAIVRDITERNKAEVTLRDAHDAIKTVNKELERKVKTRTAEVLRLAQQKDDFLHILGHDLKNPLNAIMMSLPVLRESSDTYKKEMAEIAIRNANQMNRLIDETLRLSGLDDDTFKLSCQRFNLHHEIKRICNNNKLLLKTNNVSVTNKVDEHIEIVGETLLIDEVLNNLLTNAVKYIPDTRKGIVVFEATTRKNSIVVSVTDNGCGFTENEGRFLFDKFYKTGTPRKGMTSTGLGLSICRQIIEKHKGRIWAESTGPQQGSTFYFTLPIVVKEKRDHQEKILVSTK